MAATVTVHQSDGEGRVFVGVVGQINDGDSKVFQEKTDQIYSGENLPKRVIVTLVSYGGSTWPALQIGAQIRKRGMSTLVPADRTCTSACAFVWLAGLPRSVASTAQIGFHATYDPTTRQATGGGNAIVGAYLRDLGFNLKAIFFMTNKSPTGLEWLTPDQAKEFGISWAVLQPPRAIPVPPQPNPQRGIQAPARVTAAWAKSTEQTNREADKTELKAWRKLIADRLERMKVYPPEARERKEAGVVQIFFTLNRKGQIVSSGVAKSSGHSSLDDASLEIVRKAQPFAPPPAQLKGQEISLTVPIRFNLMLDY
jgi:TonB family protein